MINFIKKAVQQRTDPNRKELSNGLACSIYTMLLEDIILYGDVYDLAEIAEIIKESYLNITNIELSECTPLDYAELYAQVVAGNSVFYLRNYQQYFGQIE